ncbi:MAG TPA: Na+/H+ antiporter NhaA [Micromonosporaceae bacterium]|nr:Na+/H+ antiporter NhaA [Micromonosporaceae bacterium]
MPAPTRIRTRPHPALRRARRRAQRRAQVAAAEVIRFLRTEQIGGLILLSATALALIVANSPIGDAYERLSDARIGPAALHLDLTAASWAKDGLLAFFFAVAGLELKRELVLGELRHPRRAMLPILCALGGMVVPALVFLAVAAGQPGAGRGWAVPVATDIAFALAVLAVTAGSLPPGVRIFLLSLAIVDDLGAILLIAVLFTASIAPLPLLGAVLVVAAYVELQRRRFRGWWLYWPLGLAAWVLVHASGVHATVAGVAIGLATRARRDRHERESPAERLEHRLQPFSAAVCVPVFAFFAAGVAISAESARAFAADRTAWAVVAGLVVGKALGVSGAALAAVRLKLARLPSEMSWHDLFAISVLTGCGFTVSLLIVELAFTNGAEQDRIKAAVLLGSLLASLAAALLLRMRTRFHEGHSPTPPRSVPPATGG